MKKNTTIYDLKYVEEHQACVNYSVDIQTGFKYEEYRKGSVIQTACVPMNYIIFFLEGSYRLTCNNHRNVIFKSNEMVCIPQDAHLHAEALTDGRVMLLGFDTPESMCDKQIFTSYINLCKEDQYLMKPVAIINPLDKFLSLLEFYLRNQMDCVHLHSIKHREFFLLLRGYYTKEQIGYFLHPAIHKLSDFRYFIKTNVFKVDTIEELVRLSHYSRAAFYRKFNEEFGGISPQLWIQQQRKPHILEVATLPGITAKEMMVQLNFNSLSTLERTCSELFGCTPTQLIKRISHGTV